MDKPLKNKLEQIYLRDQMLRQLYREAEDKFGKESDEMQYFWQLVDEQDKKQASENFEINTKNNEKNLIKQLFTPH